MRESPENGLTLSVIICSHNPRDVSLSRTLTGLRNQNLSKDKWEILLIDNGSSSRLSERFDLSWHPQSKIVREDELGLTAARLRGAVESTGPVLVFVDDDNILDPDYLEHVVVIHFDYPNLGAWGGSIRPEFEQKPADHLRDFLPALALREVSSDKWSNFSGESEPCGAGLCVRRSVIDYYRDVICLSPWRRSLDRRGQNLASAGDTDIAQTSYEAGLGTGAFARLKLTHLIPKNRVEPDYLFRLLENIAYSNTMLALTKGRLQLTTPDEKEPPPLTWKRRLWTKFIHKIERRYAPKPTDATLTYTYWWEKGYTRAVGDYRSIQSGAGDDQL